MADYQLHLGDCLEIMPTLADNSIDLILTDPPYFKVKGEAWDRQWSDRGAFLAWLGKVADEWQRVLKPNGSLYVFASPQMSWYVEGLIRDRFNVLNNIRWQKPPYSTKAEMFDKKDLRALFPASETILFAEHYGADNIAKGEAGYAAKCDELRGFVFEPLRAYIEGERIKAGVSKEDINEALGFRRMGGMAGRHYFSQSQWCLPTEDHYGKMRACLSRLNHGGAYLQRPYEELRQEYEELRQEYEELRQEYEELRRPFNATPDAPYTDVWTFPTVSHYAGKHPCEKPLALLEHAIKISSREGATVLDCFMGGGSTGHACRNTNRNFIGIEKDAGYFEIAKRRIENAQPALLEVA